MRSASPNNLAAADRRFRFLAGALFWSERFVCAWRPRMRRSRLHLQSATIGGSAERFCSAMQRVRDISEGLFYDRSRRSVIAI
jgi:hypothetical protein